MRPKVIGTIKLKDNSMELELTKFSSTSLFTREANEAASSLSINLSREELIDRKITQIQDRKDRNVKRDLLRDSLNVRNSLRELQRLIKKSSRQADTQSNPAAASNSSLGLDTSGGGDLDKAIDQVSALSSVSSGNIVIMGEKISIDVTTDSINDVIDRINNSNSGVTATFNTTDNKFEISDDQTFTISNGSSNFFSALDVTTGEIASDDEDSKEKSLKSSKVMSAFARFAKRLNKLAETTGEVSEKLGITNDEDDDGELLQDNPFLTDIKKAVENAITSSENEDFEGVGKQRFEYGLTFSFTTGEFIEFEAKEYERGMEGQAEGLIDFFLRDIDETNSKSGGLIALLDQALNEMNLGLEEDINVPDKTGLLVDVEA